MGIVRCWYNAYPNFNPLVFYKNYIYWRSRLLAKGFKISINYIPSIIKVDGNKG